MDNEKHNHPHLSDLAAVTPTVDGLALAATASRASRAETQPAGVERVATVDSEAQRTTKPVKHAYWFKRLSADLPPLSDKRITLVFVALMLTMVLIGWNEGSIGPLVPRLQEFYNIDYMHISFVYMCQFAGSLIAGIANVWITDRLGFGITTVMAAAIMSLAFMVCGCGVPYPVFLVAYAFNGFGFALQDAQTNNITTRLPNADVKMAFVQACFGLGGMVAPFISTSFSAHVKRAYMYFLVAFGVGVITVIVMIYAFDNRTEDQLVGHIDATKNNNKTPESVASESEKVEVAAEETVEAREAREASAAVDVAPAPVAPVDTTEAPSSSGAKMKRIFSTPAVYALMGWSFIYVGIEVSLSAWLTSFLIDERGGNANAGYAVTGFWGGMTVGRIVLIPLTRYLGSQTSIFFYAGIALALEVVIWQTKSLVGNAVCYAFVGFFLGPIYPVALMVLSEILDSDLRGGVMGLMGSTGGAGAAAVPLISGAIADKYGIWVIQPVAVAMIGTFTLLWALVPRKRVTSRATDKASA